MLTTKKEQLNISKEWHMVFLEKSAVIHDIYLQTNQYPSL